MAFDKQRLIFTASCSKCMVPKLGVNRSGSLSVNNKLPNNSPSRINGVKAAERVCPDKFLGNIAFISSMLLVINGFLSG